jgi:hypothetical protein
MAVGMAAVVVVVVLPSPAAAGAGRATPHAGAVASRPYLPGDARLPFPGSARAVCGRPGVGIAQCLADVLHPSGAAPDAGYPTGLSPSVIEAVYGFTPALTAGSGQTVAIVDAYDDPNAAGDLNTFSAQYGLPLECTGGSSPSPCFNFTQVNQTGGSLLPAEDSGWALEISLDIEWVHALAPAASILLVEANDNNVSSLGAAEQYAAQNAGYVSNSWGTDESSSETSWDSYFNKTGVSYFAAAGDNGGVVSWPSASPGVVSVGGTSLSFAGGTLAQESAWSSGGGGCSLYEPANAYQKTGSVTSCGARRATPDLSLDADPNSGVSVYDSYGGASPWVTVGGTSASTPMVAAEAAVTGKQVNAQYLYASPANIWTRDITAGSNGNAALPGYDLATGLGSWSFTPGAPTGLKATSVPGALDLSWSTPSGAPVGSYTIWKGTSSGEETSDLATVTGSATSYADTSVSANSSYFYEVEAVNSFGVGPPSNEASSTVGTFHTVAFNADGGTGTMAPETASVPTALTRNAFTRTGYSFSGWSTAANGSGTTYADGATFAFTASGTLYAGWKANPTGPRAPTVTGISPSSGPTSGGTAVTITGTGLSAIPGGTTVAFAEAGAVAVSCSSTTKCTATSPAGSAGTVDVVVATAGGTSKTSAADRFTYLAAPAVTSIAPDAGPTKGGTTVTIRGSNFSGAVSAWFGARPAKAVRAVSPSEIIATSPPGSGVVHVTVSATGGTSKKSPGDRFSYVAPPVVNAVTPSVGLGRGDAKATIRGSNFVGAVSVYFGTRRATRVGLLSPTEIVATAPSMSGPVFVTVFAAGGSSKRTARSRFSVVAPAGSSTPTYNRWRLRPGSAA